MGQPRATAIADAAPADNLLPLCRVRNRDRTMAIESDLSGDTAVTDDELDAIARLLGDELDTVLSDTAPD